MKTKQNLELLAPPNSLIAKAKEAFENLDRMRYFGVCLVNKRIDYLNLWEQGKGKTVAYDINITYHLAPKTPLYNCFALNNFLTNLVKSSSNLRPYRKEDSFGGDDKMFSWERASHKSERWVLDLGKLLFEEEQGKEVTRTTRKKTLFLNPSLVIPIKGSEKEPEGNPKVEKEKDTRLVTNNVRVVLYPSKDIAKNLLTKEVSSEYWRGVVDFNELRARKFYGEAYKEYTEGGILEETLGDTSLRYLPRHLHNLLSILEEKGARLQSAEEAAAFRILSDVGLFYDDSQFTRTIALFFKEKGKWFVAFDDSADSKENLLYAKRDEWKVQKDRSRGTSFLRLPLSKTDTSVKRVLDRANSSKKIMCLESTEARGLIGNPIAQAVLGRWAIPYEIYLRNYELQIEKPIPIQPRIYLPSPKRDLEKCIEQGKVEVRLVALGGLHPGYVDSATGSLFLGNHQARMLRGFSHTPESMKIE